jgi:hypothetical protein
MLVNLGWHDVIARGEASSNLQLDVVELTCISVDRDAAPIAVVNSDAQSICTYVGIACLLSLSKLLPLHICFVIGFTRVPQCLVEWYYPREICSGLEVSRRGPNPEKIELMKSFILEMRNYLKKIFLSLMVDPKWILHTSILTGCTIRKRKRCVVEVFIKLENQKYLSSAYICIKATISNIISKLSYHPLPL